MEKRKRLEVSILFWLLLFSMITVAYSHDNQLKHDNDLKYVLFGSREKRLVGREKLTFQAIADAAAITIDQFSSNDGARMKETTFNNLQDELEQLGVGKLKIVFDDIDLTKSNINSSMPVSITPNTHRCFTHQGWDYKKYPDMDFWKKRKSVLTNTVTKVIFPRDDIWAKIPFISGVLQEPSEQCDAFCAMVYYVHILGDHAEGDTPDKIKELEPLIQYRSISVPGILPELREYLQILFPSQVGSRTYISLIQELDEFTIRAEKNCGTWGSTNNYTEAQCKINQKYANELFDILAKYIPLLLRREPFFLKVFK